MYKPMTPNYLESMTKLMTQLQDMMTNVQVMYEYDWNDASDAAEEAKKLAKKAKKLNKRISQYLPSLNMIDQLAGDRKELPR